MHFYLMNKDYFRDALKAYNEAHLLDNPVPNYKSALENIEKYLAGKPCQESKHLAETMREDIKNKLGKLKI